jgi:hypothetical protein
MSTVSHKRPRVSVMAGKTLASAANGSAGKRPRTSHHDPGDEEDDDDDLAADKDDPGTPPHLSPPPLPFAHISNVRACVRAGCVQR